MHQLYDLGYQAIKSPDLLAQVVQKLDAVVLDCRFNPHSRDPKWSKFGLLKKLAERYIHVQALGNANYKNGGPIQIVNMDLGEENIRHYLETNSVILLCACAHRGVCHRQVIAQEIALRLGIVSEPLDLHTCLAMIGQSAPHQPTMFD